MSTEWMDHILCGPKHGHNPEVWYPNDVGARQRQQVARAQSICAACPVIVQCREYADGNNFGYGVWAGQNRSHAKPSGVRAPFLHGTQAGYRAHMRHHEKPCEPCRKAHSLACAEYQRKRRA